MNSNTRETNYWGIFSLNMIIFIWRDIMIVFSGALLYVTHLTMWLVSPCLFTIFLTVYSSCTVQYNICKCWVSLTRFWHHFCFVDWSLTLVWKSHRRKKFLFMYRWLPSNKKCIHLCLTVRLKYETKWSRLEHVCKIHYFTLFVSFVPTFTNIFWKHYSLCVCH